MAVAEELQIIIDAKVTQAVKDLKKVDKGLGDTGKASNRLKDIFKSLAGPVAIGAVIAGAIKFGKEMSKAASDAEEGMSKFRVVFGKTANEVSDELTNIADKTGQSTSELINFAGVIGDTLKPLGFAKDAVDKMSTEVVALAGDLGSFNNLPTEQVIRDIQSALVGNTETLRKYGVVAQQSQIEQEALNSGLWDGEAAITAQEKAQAIFNLTMKGTLDAQGDLERTYDSTANTSKRLEASQQDLAIAFGVVINEGLTPLKSALADVTKEWADLIAKQNQARAFIDDLKDGTVDTDLSLKELQDTLEGLERRRGQLGAGGFVEDEIIRVKELIANYEHVNDRIERNAQSAESYRQASVTAADIVIEKEKETAIAIDAAAEAERKRIDEIVKQSAALIETKNRVMEENEALDILANTATSVNAEFDDYNILLEERNRLSNEQLDLIAAQSAAISTQSTEIVAAGEDWLSIEQAKVDHLIWIDNLQTKINKKREQEAIALGKTIQGFVQGPLTALGEALVLGGDAWEGLGKAAIKSISGVIKALGEQATVQAAIALATGSFAEAALLATAAAGAFVAAGAIAASAETFATGGSFVTNGPTPFIAGDNTSGQERVTVERINGSSSGGGSERVTFIVDGQSFWAVMQRGIDNRKVHRSAGGVI
jgi:hypothetical protein